MATIKTALALYDGMTSPLKQITTAMHILLNTFESVQDVSRNAVDVTALQQAREELSRADIALDSIEQSIQKAAQKQQNFNHQVHDSGSAFDRLLSKARNLAGTIGAMVGVKRLFTLSDQLSGNKARLSMILDDGGSVAELEKQIMASAQRSRASYLTTAKSVSQMGLLAGDAFSSNSELIVFTETLNKQFAIAGTNVAGAQAATLQLTQAMASGVLRGEELNSVFEQAPNVIHSIADYLDVPIGQIRTMASEGKITAEIVKNAMLSAADAVNQRFESMPKTWAQVWTTMQNKAISILSSLTTKINTLANAKRLEGAIDGLMNVFGIGVAVASSLIGLLSSAGGFLYDHWSILQPLIMGVAAALAIYAGYLAITKGLEMASAAQKMILCLAAYAHAAATGAQASATTAATAAQYGLNTALLLCPLTWIILLVIALIALIYAAVAAINQFAGTSLSATGIICGAFMAAFALIGNILIALWNFIMDGFVVIYNFIAGIANFFGNVFTDPIGAICRQFFDMSDTVLEILAGLASAIDTIFGSNLASAVQGWRESLGSWVEDTFGKGTEIMAKTTADPVKFDRFSYRQAYNLGYDFGKGIDDKISGALDFSSFDPLGAFDLASGIDQISQGVGDTAGNTAAMKDALDITEENLAYMRDIAEQEAINRFTTAQIHVEQTNHNHINSSMDLDGVVDHLTSGVNEAMERAAEGVHE